MVATDSVYHVVCRECRTEVLASSKRDARLEASDHVDSTGHRVDFARVGEEETQRQRVSLTD